MPKLYAGCGGVSLVAVGQEPLPLVSVWVFSSSCRPRPCTEQPVTETLVKGTAENKRHNKQPTTFAIAQTKNTQTKAHPEEECPPPKTFLAHCFQF